MAAPSDRLAALSEILARRTLERAGRAIDHVSTVADVDQTIEQTLEEIARLIGADRAYIIEEAKDGASSVVSHEWCCGKVMAVAMRLQEIPAGAYPWITDQLRAGKVVAIPSVDRLPGEASSERAELIRRKAQAMISAPLVFGRLGFGIVAFEWASPLPQSPVTTDEMTLIQAVVSAALHERRMVASLQNTNRMLEAMIDCSDALLRAEDETVLLDDICRIIVEVGGYRLAWVGLGDSDEERTVRPVAKWGHDEGYLDNIRVTWAEIDRGNGPVSRAVRTGKPAVVESVATDPDFAPWRDAALQRGYKSVLAVSLDFEDGLPGALGVYSSQAGAFDDREVELLQRFAVYLSYGVVVLRNRTQRELVEKQLRDALKSKGELVASISHELRTPLTAVVGFAQVLQESADLGADERAAMIRSIVDEGLDLTNIVEDLLTVAKAESGTLTVVRVPVDLRAQVAQVMEELPEAEAPRVTLEGETRKAVGDPGRARQIIRNLVSNAVRYGGDEIRIELVDGERPSVRVLDNGEGVPQEDRERIFESYQKAHNAAGVTGSIGLGLAISRTLARLMDGDLTYAYVAGYSVFELTLPS